MGAIDVWARRAAGSWAGALAGLVVGLTLVGSAALGALVLARTPGFAPGLGGMIAGLAALAGLVVAIPVRLARWSRAAWLTQRGAVAAAIVGLAVLLRIDYENRVLMRGGRV